MRTITALEAINDYFTLPAWVKNGDIINLCFGNWVIVENEEEYIPCLVNGVPKLMCLHVELDCDGKSYSYYFKETCHNSEFGKAVELSDYMLVAHHISNSILG
jgi:hypothetical protein